MIPLKRAASNGTIPIMACRSIVPRWKFGRFIDSLNAAASGMEKTVSMLYLSAKCVLIA